MIRVERNAGRVFRFSAPDQYIYNLGTNGLESGTWQLGVDLGSSPSSPSDSDRRTLGE
jgi:hypothetical protein